MANSNLILKEVSIEHLHLDIENPRLPESLRKKGQLLNEENIIEWMLEDASLLDLVVSIATNGYFLGEPLLVILQNTSSDEYIVIEGNRRLAACKILLTHNKDRKRKIAIEGIVSESNHYDFPHTLPVIVFSERREILDYLGYRHVTGVQSWTPLAKSRYLQELFDVYKRENLDQNDTQIYRLLARKIASRTDYVKRLLVSYQIYKKIEQTNFFKIKGLNEDTIEFSKLSDVTTKYEALRGFLNIDFDAEDPLTHLRFDRLENISRWLFERNVQNRTRVGESRNIPILAKVVANAEALEAFSNGKPLEEAAQLTELPTEQFNDFIAESLSKLKNAYNLAYQVERFETAAQENIKEVDKLIQSIIELVKFKSSENKRQRASLTD